MTPRSFATLIARHFAALYVLTIVGLVAVWYFGLESFHLQGERDRHIELDTRQLELSADFRIGALQQLLMERRTDFHILANTLERLGAAKATPAALSAEFSRQMEALAGTYDRQFQLLMVVNPSPLSVLASTTEAKLDPWLSDAVQRASELGIQELLEHWPRSPGVMDFVLLRPLRAVNAQGQVDGPPLGVLVGVLDPNSLLQALVESVGKGGAHFTIGTQDGHLTPLHSSQSLDNTLALELLRQAQAGQEGTYQRTLADGRPVVAVYRDVSLGGERGLWVVHFQTVDDMLGELPRVRNKVLALGGVLLVLGFGLARWLARRATAPLAELSQAAAEFGAGVKDRRAQVTNDASVEFAALAQRFNAMADRVTVFRETLEAQVLERTQALAESRQRLALALDAGAIGVWELDPPRNLLVGDERMCEMYGVASDRRAGTVKDWLKRVHPDDRERVTRELEGILAEGEEGYESEFRVIRHETDLRHVHNRARVLRDANGSAIRVIGVSQDISKSKATEAELRTMTAHLEEIVAERTAALNALFTALPDLYFRVAADGTILDHRAGDQQLLYLPPSAFMGKKMQEVLPPHLTPLLNHHLAATLSTQSMQSLEYELTLQGVNRVFEARMLPTRLGDVAIVAQDISARKKIEIDLASAKEKAESANVAKSAFLANMSHEIRTPLNAVLGMAYLIRRDGVSPTQAERLDKLEAASEHLLEVINTVLDLSKIEAGKFELEDRPVDLSEITGRTRTLLQARAAAKQLQFEVDVPALSCKLRGDPTRLQQALLNYATNAIKFTEHGSVTMRVRLTAEDEHSATLRFEVADTGVGIALDAQPRLFNAFEQADNSTTRTHGGTGLGLVITKRIAELMGGEAGMSSVLGQGSTFWFTARLRKDTTLAAAQPSQAHATDATLRSLHAGKRVLPVDDEPINREITSQMLEYAGLVVECASDGAQAVARVEQQEFALVLMDLQMPIMDGIEASQRIRQQQHARQVPILALTANVFQAERERCIAAGMNGFIIKPVEPDALFETVCRWLGEP